MIRGILKIGLLLLVGVIGYNYFFGTPEEKEKSREIIGKAVDVGKAGVGLLKEEVDKFKSGKYDNALEKVGGLLKKAKNTAEEKGGDLLNRIEDWEANREKWQERKDQLKDLFDEADDEEKEKIKEKIKEINEEGQQLEEEGKKLQEEVGDDR